MQLKNEINEIQIKITQNFDWHWKLCFLYVDKTKSIYRLYNAPQFLRFTIKNSNTVSNLVIVDNVSIHIFNYNSKTFMTSKVFINFLYNVTLFQENITVKTCNVASYSEG